MGTTVIGLVFSAFAALNRLLAYGQRKVTAEIAEINTAVERREAALRDFKEASQERILDLDLVLAKSQRLSGRLQSLTD